MLRSADRYYATSRALVERAAREARKDLVSTVVLRHQAAAASVAAAGVSSMLAEQGTPVPPEGNLNPIAFTASASAVDELASKTTEGWQLDRLVMSLVADAARGAESVSIASRPRVGYVRYVNAPCCSRCAILAGRFYRWSSGFQRHPGCDCTHLPTTDPRSEFIQNPYDLVEQGKVTGISKADRRALADGADLNQLVNFKNGSIRRVNFGPGRTASITGAGTSSRGIAGKALGDLQKTPESRYRQSSRMRLTPDSIYRVAGSDQAQAIRLLRLNGYIT